MVKNLLKRLKDAFLACLRSPTFYPSAKYREFDVDACAEEYIKNIETAKNRAASAKAEYLNFLQPFIGGSSRTLTPFEKNAVSHIIRRRTIKGNNELGLINKFYDVVREKTKGKSHVHDLRNIFDSYNGDIYFDQTHCSDIGYDLIAKKIAKEIIKIESGNRA